MDQQSDVRRKLQFRLPTLLAAVILAAVVLGGWFGWVRPRFAFETLRRETMDRLDWTGKDAEFEYRTSQIKRALEQYYYNKRHTLSLAYAGIKDEIGILNVDWIGTELGKHVRGIEINGDKLVRIPIESDDVEHDEGLLNFGTTLRSSDHPGKWPQLTDTAKLQIRLIIGETEYSNPIDLTIVP